MKKLTIKFLLLISVLSIFVVNGNSFVHAEGTTTKIRVTEKIPGAGCDPVPNKKNLYECKIEPGFGSVVAIMGKMIKYFVFLASLGGVLFIVINGIMYSMGGADQGLKDESKKRIVQTLIGLVLLFLSGVILNLIAPWIWVL